MKIFFIISIFVISTGCNQNYSTNYQQQGSTEQAVATKKVNENANLRNVSWGMTMSDVQDAEKEAEFIGKFDDNLLYKTSVNGLDFKLGYYFIDDKLYNAAYILDETHTSENQYISDYENLKAILTEKYGIPNIDKVIWKDDLYKDNQNDWGFAVSIGDLAYLTQWQSHETKIGIFLAGDNYDVALGIVYDSNELSPIAEQKNNEDVKSSL